MPASLPKQVLLLGLLLFAHFGGQADRNFLQQEENWHFIAIKDGVKFYWREDPSWHHVYIKAENPTDHYVNYRYSYEVFIGEKAVDMGQHRWFRLRPKDKNAIKIARELTGTNSVRLSKLEVERYR